MTECDQLLVANGALNDSSVVYGTVVEISCDPCFHLQGDGIANCQHDGTWNFLSSCTEKSE